jgi:C-terminal processing protease CtpA/Prc
MFFTFASLAVAQAPAAKIPITPEQRRAVIEKVIVRVNHSYVFPEVAAQVEKLLRESVEKREFDNISDQESLASALTERLLAVSHDKHLKVRFSPDVQKENDYDTGTTPEQQRAQVAREAEANFGFNALRHLDGNIGYIEYTYFANANASGASIAAAFNFLRDSDALIIDLRNNGGGWAESVPIWCSYLLPPEPVHLLDNYYRESGHVDQVWSLPWVPGERFLNKPVYVLTGKETFSAAEALTFILKEQGRATIVGTATRGGANPLDFYWLTEHMDIGVPDARSMSVKTKQNWEGVGIQPDIAAPEADALRVAQIAILNGLLKKKVPAYQQREIEKALHDLAARVQE